MNNSISTFISNNVNRIQMSQKLMKVFEYLNSYIT